MSTVTLNTIIDDFNALPFDEKEFAIDLINKTYAEAKREAIFKNAQKAVDNFEKGNVKRGEYKDLYKDLEND
jgi:hypothetical protein